MPKIKVKKTESLEYPELKVTVSRKIFNLTLIAVLVIVLLFVSKKYFIAAIVNGRPISRLAVIKDLEKQGGKKVLDNLIVKTLILQEVKKRKINIDQKTIDEEIKKIEANIKSQGSTLDQALQTQGMKKSDLVDEIRIQLSLQKMAGDDVKVTDKEVEDFITANKNQQGFDKEIPKEQAAAQLKQQKLQQKIQSFVTDLKAKAKITYFVSY